MAIGLESGDIQLFSCEPPDFSQWRLELLLPPRLVVRLLTDGLSYVHIASHMSIKSARLLGVRPHLVVKGCWLVAATTDPFG